MYLLLSLICASQASGESATRDRYFAASVEQWVASDASTEALISQFASPRWLARETATAELGRRIEIDPSIGSCLMPALMSRDLEVRHRAGAIVRRLSLCPKCHGECGGSYWNGWGFDEWACGECQGKGLKLGRVPWLSLIQAGVGKP